MEKTGARRRGLVLLLVPLVWLIAAILPWMFWDATPNSWLVSIQIKNSLLAEPTVGFAIWLGWRDFGTRATRPSSFVYACWFVPVILTCMHSSALLTTHMAAVKHVDQNAFWDGSVFEHSLAYVLFDLYRVSVLALSFYAASRVFGFRLSKRGSPPLKRRRQFTLSQMFLWTVVAAGFCVLFSFANTTYSIFYLYPWTWQMETFETTMGFGLIWGGVDVVAAAIGNCFLAGTWHRGWRWRMLVAVLMCCLSFVVSIGTNWAYWTSVGVPFPIPAVLQSMFSVYMAGPVAHTAFGIGALLIFEWVGLEVQWLTDDVNGRSEKETDRNELDFA